VPSDLFGGPDRPITPDQVAGLSFTGVNRGMNQLAGVNLNTSGELLRLFGDRPIGLALGYEFRTVEGEFTPDPITVAGLTTGNKGLITSGSYYVNEATASCRSAALHTCRSCRTSRRLPRPRVFKYSTFGSDWTYKFGARYTPVRDMTVRGTYSTAFRARASRTCSSARRITSRRSRIRAVETPGKGPPVSSTGPCGAAANNGDTSSQLRSQNGGVPTLRPETAKTWTIGLVLEPTAVKTSR